MGRAVVGQDFYTCSLIFALQICLISVLLFAGTEGPQLAYACTMYKRCTPAMNVMMNKVVHGAIGLTEEDLYTVCGWVHNVHQYMYCSLYTVCGWV